MNCEICGKKLGNEVIIYTSKDGKIKMYVCPECAVKEEEVKLKWKEKTMLKRK